MTDTIAIDFDGTIHAYTSGWTGPEPLDGPIPGAVDFVRGLIESGYAVEVFSARIVDQPDAADHIKAWLDRNGFPPMKVSCEKGPHYVAFVDDRAVPFRGDYEATRRSLDALLANPKWWAEDEITLESHTHPDDCLTCDEYADGITPWPHVYEPLDDGQPNLCGMCGKRTATPLTPTAPR